MARPLGKRSKSAKTESSELRAMVLSIDSHEADRRHGPQAVRGGYMQRPYAQGARGMPRCYRCSHRTMVGKCARKNHADSGKITGAGGILPGCAIPLCQLRFSVAWAEVRDLFAPMCRRGACSVRQTC